MLLHASLSFFAALACPGSGDVSQGGPGQGGAVVVNELVYDDTGADDRELVELYNSGPNAVNLAGWSLDVRPANGPPVVYTLPPGLTLQARGFLVIGGPNAPGVQVVLGNGNLFPDDAGSLGLRDAGSNLVDGVAWEGHRGVSAASLGEGTPLWGEMESLDSMPTSWSRLRDGYDTGDNGRDFRLAPMSAGASNDLPARSSIIEAFDSYASGAPVPGFGGSVKPVRTIDPTQTSSLNPTAIPASPQGGKAAVFFDEAGHGNANMLLADAADRVRFEAWVYFDATPAPSGEWQAWTIGVQGTASSFYGRPDPGRVLPVATANGNTGLGWTYVVDSSGGKLYFVDDGAGGDGHTIVTMIPIVPGSNDGWQRLRIFADDKELYARFGGSFGQQDGTLVEREVRGAVGGVYFAYGDGYGNPSARRALTIDNLQLALGGGGDPIYTINGGSGCQGNCPVLNVETKEVTGALGPAGQEYAILVQSTVTVNVDFVCFFTGRYSISGSDPVVRIYADTGSGPAASPIATRTMPVPASSGLGWYASNTASPFALSFVPSPTVRFWISIETDGSCYLPIAPAGALAPIHYFRTGGAWTVASSPQRFAYQLVCPDTSAEVVMDALGEPQVGNRVDIAIGGAPYLAPVFLALGGSNTVWNGIPLPLDLGFLGAPTCSVNSSPDVMLGVGASGMGRARIPVTIPSSPFLVGLGLYGQWFAVDLRANALRLVTSQRLEIMIGS